MFGERTIGYRAQAASRLWLHALAVLIIAFALWAAAGRMGEYISAGSAYHTERIVVQQGDTVWSVARQYGPQGWDVRKTVDMIQELNGLTGADLGRLQPGQELHVPRKP